MEPPSIASTLPPEILHLIFSAAAEPTNHRQQQHTYAVCTLVNRRWYRPAQRALWRNPYLPSKAKALKFLERHLNQSCKESSPHCLVRCFDLTALRFSEPEDTDLLKRFANGTPLLESLKIFCDPLDPRTLQHVLTVCPKLVDLTLTGSVGGMQSRFFYELPPVRSMELHTLSSRLMRLRSLHWGSVDCTRGDGQNFAKLLATSVGPSLREFSVGMVTPPTGQIPVEDAILALIAHNCPALEVVSVQGKPVTDRCLESLARYCPRLTAIDLQNCSGITRDGVIMLVRACPQLSDIRIKGTLANDSVVRNVIAMAAMLRRTVRRRAGRIFAP
ncbi:uncharacterized protein SPPG_06953 [Spizellomyces punctatus DAOM BR117]|uniref:F-box domain-containing protein n=1 Tax=Spizellomyces punctatus (strain DAOM BR117) TaxID=645134 RepID=A0A0L0H8V1_SPIPD|nr:uncharacterized protein SPPG_06953 [Spizellomyces punctatus DAOM BR117]KNC97965.1 hypothetical protein SPPG_06953 [Spizellomyces punctatus DAOM BR117]|eukprot:XP_016606005.1 hypothetical protein SPPG_06953 [Spizellomyces punctatus DAOM BR117]